MTVDVHLGPDDIATALRHDVETGLTAEPKWLPPKWFYDEAGSHLFDDITRLPEYYPTRTERAILTEHADAIAARSGADTLVELGSGTSDKTRLLLDALQRAGTLRKVVLLDVSEAVLREAADTIAAAYPGVAVHAIVGDFERHLGTIPAGGRRLVVFLGGTIGNFFPDERARFLDAIRALATAGDSFLLGTDLVKDVARLEAAYDDAQGVTAAFNKNVLHVVNRELRADFDVDAFEHVAFFDRTNEWIEMRLRSTAAQAVMVDALGLKVFFEDGEEMRTEISAKFTPERVSRELAAARFDVAELWTDGQRDFGVSLSTPRLP